MRSRKMRKYLAIIILVVCATLTFIPALAGADSSSSVTCNVKADTRSIDTHISSQTSIQPQRSDGPSLKVQGETKKIIVTLEVSNDSSPPQVRVVSVTEERESKKKGWSMGIGAGPGGAKQTEWNPGIGVGFGAGKVKKAPGQEEITKICEDVIIKTGLKCSVRYEDDTAYIEVRPK